MTRASAAPAPEPELRTHILVLACYVVFFAAYFSQFLIVHGLGGNTDTMLAVSLTNTWINQVGSFLSGVESGVSMYPAPVLLSSGESAPGSAMIFAFFRMLGLEDVSAYYCWMVLVFGSSAYAVFLLARSYLTTTLPAVFAGFVFTTAGFTFANIDDPILVFFLFPCLSIILLKRYIAEGKSRTLVAAAVLGGLQVYFSAYVFAFQTMCLGLLVLIHWKASAIRHNLIRVAATAGLYLLIAAPFFGSYARAFGSGDVFDPWQGLGLEISEVHSLDPVDFVRPLDENMLYPAHSPVTGNDLRDSFSALRDSGPAPGALSKTAFGVIKSLGDEFSYVSDRKKACIGLLVYILALIGIVRGLPGRTELLVLGASALFIALGPTIVIGDILVPTPMYVVHKYVPGADFLRLPLRAFFVTLLVLGILAARGLEVVIERVGPRVRWKAAVVSMTALSLFLVENLPWPLRVHELGPHLEAPQAYLEFFADSDDAVILDLPSDTGASVLGSGDGLYPYNREILYMNWQTQHRQNILGGVNGYLPLTRVHVQTLASALPDKKAIRDLVTQFDLQYLVVHKKIVFEHERAQIERIRNSPCLEKLLDTSEITILKPMASCL